MAEEHKGHLMFLGSLLGPTHVIHTYMVRIKSYYMNSLVTKEIHN
jgi:hypothetical protein